MEAVQVMTIQEKSTSEADINGTGSILIKNILRI